MLYALWNHSLKRKLSVFVTVTLLVPMLVTTLYFYGVVRNLRTEQMYKNFDQAIEQSQDAISGYMALIENTYLSLIKDPTFRERIAALSEGSPTWWVRQELDQWTRQFLYFNHAWESELLRSIYVYTGNQTYSYEYDNLFNRTTSSTEDAATIPILQRYEGVFKERIAAKERIGMILPPTNEGDKVYYARDFYDLNSGKFVGLILLGMNETVLAGSYQSHFNYEDSRGMILDRDGHILSHVDKGMIGKVAAPAIRELESGRPRELLLNGRRQLVAARELGDHGLRAIVVVPHAEVFGGLNDSIANYLYMSTALALLFIFISFLLSRQVTKHIDVLVNKFELVHEGDFSIQIEEYEELELRKLSRIFNEMMRHIQYLIRDVYEKQLLLKEAELKGLRAQINPHFVFNTLLSIGFKAKKSDNEEVFEMVNSLSELLQLSVYTSPDEKTSVANELQTLSYYVKLQQIRFADRMTIDISQIEEEVRELAIPKLCLQPLVENAILHGLEPQVGPGNLVLRGRKDRGLLIFEVLDDGVGFDTSQVDLEGPVTAEKHDNNHTNIGLVNTHKRIQHLYGAAYGLELQSEKGNGTKVIVRIPSESFRE